MLKIIQNGNSEPYNNRVERFDCLECGCVFEVKVRDCQKIFAGNSFQPSLIYECPCCKSPTLKRHDYTIRQVCIPM